MGEKSWNSRGFWSITAAVAFGMILSETIRSSVGAVVIPFIIAYIAAKLVRPCGVVLSRVCKIREKIGCTVWGVIVCFAVGYAITNLSGKLWEQISSVVDKLPDYAEDAAMRIGSLSERLTSYLHFPDVDGEICTIVNGAFRQAASELGGAAAGMLGSAVSGFPGGILSVFVTVAAFLYLVADMDGAGESLRKVIGCILPENIARRTVDTFDGFANSVFTYLRAYVLLMLVTFFELSVGFTIIGAQEPLAVALIVSLVDALPLLGCGAIIVPWALWSFLEGGVRCGIGLLLIQAIVYIVRQFLEPRLIGKMSGVHPFIALAVLFAGLKIGGVGGMVCAPIMLMSVMRMRGND